MTILTPQQFGLFIRELRKKKAWTQVELARQAKLRQASISAIEKGEGGTLQTLFRILHVLGAEMRIKDTEQKKSFDVEEYFASLTSKRR